tara:strand:+ start:1992 stop:2228 length:237 start_codon:yes stop_codon:yes gene_type:complete
MSNKKPKIKNKDKIRVTIIFYIDDGDFTFEDITLKDFDAWLEDHNKCRQKNGDRVEVKDEFAVYHREISLKEFSENIL